MFLQILSTYKQSFAGLSKESWILSIVILINRCGFMAAPFMGLYLTQALHRSKSEAALLISIFGVGAILGAAVGGKLTDLIGFRPVQIFASIFGGIFFLIFAHVDDFIGLCILSFFISFFVDAFRPANFAAVAVYAKPGTETRSYSLNRIANNIGWAFGVSLGGLIAAYNYTLLFYVDGLVTISVGLAIWYFLPETEHKKAREKIKKEVDNNESAAINDSGSTQNKKKLIMPWQDKAFIYFILIDILFTTCFFMMFRVVPVYFKEDWHINEAYIGLILGVNGIVIALFEMVLIAKIENKRSFRYYIIMGVLITGFAFGLLMLPKLWPILLAIVCVIAFTIGEMLSIPFINTIVIKRSQPETRGQYAAGYTIAWSLAQVIGPSSGFLFAEIYGYNALWLVVTGIVIFCAVAYYYVIPMFKSSEIIGIV
ncbi:MAG: MFS transporter [Pedobacter sp.]|nr:MAG: MFS transporter [Pedobacter sp.]